MNWSKTYIYAGSRLLSTITKSGSSELTEYHHPDRLGTKLVTDTTANTAKSQSTLPFGTEITAETQATTNQKFTTYDRSGATGLDYAVNRTYNSGQSRFTQVDPIGMGDTSLSNPQSMNLFAYTRSNPIDFTDPSGLSLNNCPAEFSSCGGGWDPGNPNNGGWGFGGSGFDSNRAYQGLSSTQVRQLKAYEQRLQNTYDAIDANRALQRYLSSGRTDSSALERFRELV